MKLSETYLVSVFTYRFEAWTLSKTHEIHLDEFEKKVLRKIFDPVCAKGQSRSRYNEEPFEIYEDIVSTAN